MKKLFVCLIVLSVSMLAAQDMRTLDKGLLFGFSGLSNLGLASYTGGSAYSGIGAKIFMKSGNAAVRPMLVFGTSKEESVSSVQDYVGPVESSTTYGILVDYIKHLNKNNITPFVGAGAGYVSRKQKEESGHMKSSEPDIQEHSATGFQVRGIIGVEIFVKKNFSLSGEYHLGYGKQSTENKSKSGSATEWSKSESKASGINLGSSGFLTVAIYLN